MAHKAATLEVFISNTSGNTYDQSSYMAVESFPSSLVYYPTLFIEKQGHVSN